MWAQPVQYAPAEEMSRPAHPTEIRTEGNVTRCGRLYMNSAAGIIRTCFSYNGIQRKTPRIRPRRFLMAASGKCGGTAKKATPGRPLFMSGPAGRLPLLHGQECRTGQRPRFAVSGTCRAMGSAEKCAGKAVRRFGGEPQPCVVAL